MCRFRLLALPRLFAKHEARVHGCGRYGCFVESRSAFVQAWRTISIGKMNFRGSHWGNPSTNAYRIPTDLTCQTVVTCFESKRFNSAPGMLPDRIAFNHGTQPIRVNRQ